MKKFIVVIGLVLGMSVICYGGIVGDEMRGPWRVNGNGVFDGTDWHSMSGDADGIDINDINAGTQTNPVKIEIYNVDQGPVTLTSDDYLETAPYGLNRTDPDAGFIASGQLVFHAIDDLSTEKFSASIDLGSTVPHLDNLYLLAVEKDILDKAAKPVDRDLTITTYNEITFHNSSVATVTHSTHTVEANSSNDVWRDYIVQGLFIGEGTIKLGAEFASNATVGTATPATIYWNIHKF